MDAKKTECFSAAGSAAGSVSSNMPKKDAVEDRKNEAPKFVKSPTGVRERKSQVDCATEDQTARQQEESGLSDAASSINLNDKMNAARDAATTARNAALCTPKLLKESSAAFDISRECISFAARNDRSATNDEIRNHYLSIIDQWLKINTDIEEAAKRVEAVTSEGIDYTKAIDAFISKLAKDLKTIPDDIAEREAIEATDTAKSVADGIYKAQYELMVAVKTCWQSVSYEAIGYPDVPGEKICECSFGRWMWLIALCFFFTLGCVLICLPYFVILHSTAYHAVKDVGITLVTLCVVIGLSVLLKPRCSRIYFMHKRSKKLDMCEKYLQDLAKYDPGHQEASGCDASLSEHDELPQDCSQRQPLL